MWCLYPTISHYNATVLLTLLLAIEFIAVALAASILEGHTLSSGGVEGPQLWEHFTGTSVHGEPTGGWGTKHSVYNKTTPRTDASGASLYLHMLTLSAAALQTLLFSHKVVLVAHTASKGEHLTGHDGRVVMVALQHPETRTRIWLGLTRFYTHTNKLY